MDLNEIWLNVLTELQVSLSKANFNAWFKKTFIIEYKNRVFTIGVPSFFVEDWFKKKYLKEITKSLQNQVDDPIAGIKFKTAIPNEEQNAIFGKSTVIHKAVDNSPAKEETKSAPKETPKIKAQTLPKNSTLNEDYKFENFVVGSSNQVAHAAAMAVAAKPGQNYNPLYIYGNSGLGKTHLMQAIGHTFLEKYPDKCVLYTTSEEFVNDYINAIQAGSGKAKDFKNRYRNVDMLLIDDIQFLARKEGTQEEFFHTFNHLHQNKKQVVLTSDSYPQDIKGLESRLQTRFSAGMVTDISQPDLETREAILRQKAIGQNKIIDDKIINFIAQNIQSSIRELEGALTKIIATCELINCDVTIEKASEILKGIVTQKRQTITPDLIIREVHKYYDMPIEELLGRKRTKEVVLPRQIAMYLLRHESNLSYPEVGRAMGGKDHSTIIHGCEKIEANISQNQQIKEDLFKIKENIYRLIGK